jgi:hypothetical protein
MPAVSIRPARITAAYEEQVVELAERAMAEFMHVSQAQSPLCSYMLLLRIIMQEKTTTTSRNNGWNSSTWLSTCVSLRKAHWLVFDELAGV